MSMNADQLDVVVCVNKYLSGISDASVAEDRVQSVLYSSTNLQSRDENGDLKLVPRDKFVHTVLSGEVPTHGGEILAVEVINDMAFAKVHLDFPDRDYFDYLTLLKLNVGWRIVSKTFTSVPKSIPQTA